MMLIIFILDGFCGMLPAMTPLALKV